MFESRRDDLDYTLDDYARLLKAVSAEKELPMFPDSDKYEQRKAIYEVLSSFPRIKRTYHNEAFEYAKSSNTTPGLKSKRHYENDPDGIRKHEIWEMLRTMKRKYYDVIRLTEKAIISKDGTILNQSIQANQVFEDAVKAFTTQWETGKYRKPSPKVRQKTKPRAKRNGKGCTLEEARIILAKNGIHVCTKTIRNWDKGLYTPKGYPSRDDAVALGQWALSTNYQAKRDEKTIHMSEEAMSKHKRRGT